MKYDCILAVGCSFVHGSAIEDENGRPDNDQYRFSKVLSDKLNLPEVNLARPGGSNERILRKIYEFFTQCKEYKNPLIIIGLSGLSRTQIYSNTSESYWDNHILDQFGQSGDALKNLMARRADKFWGDSSKWKELIDWTEKYVRYFYNPDKAKDKLHRELTFLDGYLKSKNIDYFIFNSLSNDIEEIKANLPFISFNVNKDSEVNEDISELEDCWYHYLRVRHYNEVCKDFNDYSFRSPTPPHGKFFCNGHPSSNAHKELAERLLNRIKLL